MHRLVAGVLACSLALVACGGGDDDDSAGAPAAPDVTTAATLETTTTTVAQTETYEAETYEAERYEFETREETYVDSSRPTNPNGDYQGAPDRTIRVVFRVPKGSGPFPVVLFSHGWIATPEIYNAVLDELAANGYLAIAPAYPLSNGAAPGGPIVGDVVNQPADASFVLDGAIAASNDESSWLYGLVDEEHIAAGGHSLGAFTTLGFYNSCCPDDRIDATFPVAGSMPGYNGTWFGSVDTPILLIHGDQDELVPYGRSQAAYEQANSPKYFLTLITGKHADFALGAGTEQWELSMEAILSFLDGYLHGNEAALEELSEIANVEGVSTLVSS